MYKEKYRPQFHFTPPNGWMNDPNGLIYFRDEYHLFYQHNPYSLNWDSMHWGHAVSKDMLHWQHLPVAYTPETEIDDYFSGSSVIDEHNVTGFFRPGQKGMVNVFTHRDSGVQQQHIGYSADGRHFTRYLECVLPNPGREDFRDPKVVWLKDKKRYLMVPTYAAGYQDNTIKAWKSPNPADNHIIATLHCYEPGDFCIWGNRKAYDAKHTQNRLDQLFPKMKAHFTDNGIPLILGELNADIRYYDAEHLQPNEDARIRWIWHYTNEARKYGFPIILWESGGSKGMGLIDRFKVKWANEAFVDAFLGATRGTMDEAGAIELAKKAKVSLSSIYEKTDEVLRWKIASDSYARVWGQTMGFGNLNGGGVCMRYLSSDDKGNLIVNTKGQGGNMLHQQFWADQSVTARRTYKAYVVTHGDTPLAGRKLCFTLTARNGSTAFVQGFFRIPGIKDTIPFGADWGKPGCLAATPDNPVRHVEVPIPPTEAVWKAASSGGISMELKFFPGPWNSGKALDCVLSPITLQ